MPARMNQKGEKISCEKCRDGHRVASCMHIDRPQVVTKAQGRPKGAKNKKKQIDAKNRTPVNNPLAQDAADDSEEHHFGHIGEGMHQLRNGAQTNNFRVERQPARQPVHERSPLYPPQVDFGNELFGLFQPQLLPPQQPVQFYLTNNAGNDFGASPFQPLPQQQLPQFFPPGDIGNDFEIPPFQHLPQQQYHPHMAQVPYYQKQNHGNDLQGGFEGLNLQEYQPEIDWPGWTLDDMLGSNPIAC